MLGRKRRALGLALLAGGLFVLGVEIARAQFPGRAPYGNRQQRDRRGWRAEQPNLPSGAAFGTVDGVALGRMQVTSDSGQKWLLQILPTSEVRVLATATPEFLSPRQFVSFTAQVNKHQNRVEGKITKLKIFTPDEAHTVGAFPEGAGAFAAGEGLQAPAEKAEGGQRAASGAGFEPFQIAGQITSAKNGKLIVAVPNNYFKATLKVEVAEDAVVEVDIAGAALYRLAKKGDKVEATGGLITPQVLQVYEMNLTLAEPLGKVEKKARRGGHEEEKVEEKEQEKEEKEKEKE